MTRSTLLTTHKVPINNFNYLASQLRQAGAKFRSSIQKQEATIVFSQLPSNALSILESSVPIQQFEPTDLDVESSIESSHSTLAGSNDVAPFIPESPSNMESSEHQEKIPQEAAQALAEIQQIKVDKTTAFVDLIEESSMDNLVETTTDESVESEEIAEPIREFSTDDGSKIATEQQLLELSKTKLKKLANKYDIAGRSKLSHSELAAALANKVPLDNL